ncbi:MAG TPA: DUF3237 family protein [Steroidobacteraceae bacterium]|nr:DUF3237 family protein [Steroidobacteraceae bacterium]
MRDFVVPKTDTKIQGEVRLEYAFQLTAHYDPPKVSQTPKGAFRYQDIVSGEVRGAHLNATVYPDSGGQYDTVRSDKIRDVDAHFMLKAENGEWIYMEHVGYRRPDGYYRAIAYVDAETKGAYDWLNNTTFVVTAQESADQREVVFHYYVAN